MNAEWAAIRGDLCVCGHPRLNHRDDRRNPCSKCDCRSGFIRSQGITPTETGAEQ